MSSIFSKIVAGEIPCYKIDENEKYFAFLDIAPLSRGHVLVIPKMEVDYVFDLDSDIYLGLFEFSKTIAKALDKAIDCKRVVMQIIGLEVPHAHVHLIPIQNMQDCNFDNDKLKLSKDEFEEIASKIILEITKLKNHE